MSVARTDTDTEQTDAPSAHSWRKWLVPAVSVAVVLVLLAVVAVLGVGTTPVCSACHAPQATALAKTAHTRIACASCHFAASGPVSSRLDVIFRMAPASLGGVRLTSPGKLVGNAPCLACHPKLLDAGMVKRNGLTINHTTCVTSTGCENCHGQAMHGSAARYVRTPSMAACIACHTARKATLSCSACHAEPTASTKGADPEWTRTHGADWKAMHGTGDLRSCAACHPSGYCKKCHHVDYPHPANIGTLHGALSRKAGVDACLTCHKQRAYCSACHGIEMPHPSGFLQKHPHIATSTKDPHCVRCHVSSDCVQCHIYHTHPGGPDWTLPPGANQ
jgi:hypothetical protein